MSEGLAVPEADRAINKAPIYNKKKTAIPGIPMIDEEGADILNGSNSEHADQYKQSVYADDFVVRSYDTAQKMIGTDRLEDPTAA